MNNMNDIKAFVDCEANKKKVSYKNQSYKNIYAENWCWI